MVGDELYGIIHVGILLNSDPSALLHPPNEYLASFHSDSFVTHQHACMWIKQHLAMAQW